MRTKTKYIVDGNIDGFRTSFNSKKEADIHILETLAFAKNNLKYSGLELEIQKIQVESNPKKEIFRYFLDY